MTTTWTAVVMFAVCVIIAALLFPALYKLQGREHWYNEGWRDCEEVHNRFEMTSDDELVLKVLKTALWDYMKLKGYQRKGDKKMLNQIQDFADFKMYVWTTCLWRKENKQ